MREDKFKVIDFIRNFIVVSEKELDNFPKRDIEIKHRIRTNTYDLLEVAYEANSAEDKEYKISLILKMIAKIKVLDFLMNLSYDKKLITEKKYYKLAQRLDDIIKFASGWMKKLRKNESTKQVDSIEIKKTGEHTGINYNI